MKKEKSLSRSNILASYVSETNSVDFSHRLCYTVPQSGWVQSVNSAFVWQDSSLAYLRACVSLSLASLPPSPPWARCTALLHPRRWRQRRLSKPPISSQLPKQTNVLGQAHAQNKHTQVNAVMQQAAGHFQPSLFHRTGQPLEREGVQGSSEGENWQKELVRPGHSSSLDNASPKAAVIRDNAGLDGQWVDQAKQL